MSRRSGSEPRPQDAASAPLRLRPMTRGDVHFGMRLKAEAAWNQTAEDWENFLAFRPEGCFVAEWEERPAGTVTTITHGGKVGWIGMVLVLAEMRRRGIGTFLLRSALESLDAVEVVKLDATAAGRGVYRPLGFQDELTLERRVRPAGAGPGAPAPVRAGRVRPLLPADLPAVALLDRRAFGVDRLQVLEAWLRGAPDYGRVLERQGEVRGYSLGREGARAAHLGPIVACEAAEAQALLASVLESRPQAPFLIDAFTAERGWLEHLEGLGFALERTFTRMRRGPDSFPAQTALQWAAAGPEVG